jgi:hypothetical protein
VLAEEAKPPEGVEPLSWMLLTTVPVQSVEDAIEKLDWYTKRWGIEIFHKTLKSLQGGRAATRQRRFHSGMPGDRPGRGLARVSLDEARPGDAGRALHGIFRGHRMESAVEFIIHRRARNICS